MLLVNTARGSGATARADASCGARGSRPPFAIAEPSLGSSAEARIPIDIPVFRLNCDGRTQTCLADIRQMTASLKPRLRPWQAPRHSIHPLGSSRHQLSNRLNMLIIIAESSRRRFKSLRHPANAGLGGPREA